MASNPKVIVFECPYCEEFFVKQKLLEHLEDCTEWPREIVELVPETPMDRVGKWMESQL